MNKCIHTSVALLLVLIGGHASAEVWQARYGVAETFDFRLYNADGTLDVDEADGGAEVSVSCNEGAETTATNDFVDEGTFYSIALTSGEMQCERIAVVVAATTTEVFFIQTIDSTSAMTPTIVQTGDSFARIGAAGAGLTNIDLPNQTMDIAGTITTATNVTNGVNTTSISGDSGAADTLETWLDGTAGPASPLGIARQGTAQSATGTTLVLDSSASFADDTATGMTLVACGSTQGYCQARAVTDYVLSTDTATVDTWTVTPSGTITYYLYSTAPSTGGSGLDAAGVRAAVGLASANLDAQLGTIDDYVDTEVAAIKTKTDYLPSATAGASGGLFIAGTNAATTITTGLTTTFTGNLTGSVGSVTGAVGSVIGNVGGNVTGSVGSVASGGITAASIATDAIGAAELAADAVTEIQGGLATESALGTVDDFVDDLESRIGTPSNLGGGATLADNLVDIESQTDDIGAAGAGLTAADDAVLAAIAALNNLSADQVWQYIVEDQGTVQARCAMAAVLAIVGGDVTTTGTSSTFKDASGAETRAAGVVVSNGNRSMTLTCPIY